MTELTKTLFQGDFIVSADPDICIVTVLGSCVAACLFDPVAEIGGANHFLVAEGPQDAQKNLRFGLHAMELLINALYREGANRRNLRAKVFGGASMFNDLADIGRENARFALEFLENEGIPCVSSSVLGHSARRIRFWPTSGRVQQRIASPDQVVPVPASPGIRDSGSAERVTLF